LLKSLPRTAIRGKPEEDFTRSSSLLEKEGQEGDFNPSPFRKGLSLSLPKGEIREGFYPVIPNLIGNPAYLLSLYGRGQGEG
jgi:hypothetical protein